MSESIGVHRRHPFRRFAANGAATILAKAQGPFEISPSALIERAAEASLGDDGSSPEPDLDELLALVREPLSILCDDFAGPAKLNAFGRLAAHTQLVKNLRNRIEVSRWLAANPEAARAPVDAPLIVIGLPRTGTTVLQQLLALDDRSRVLRAWEAAAPAPPPTAPVDEDDPRWIESQSGFRTLARISPKAAAIHHVEPHLPTECVALLANTFGSLEHAGIHNVPGHLEWVVDADPAPHYDFLVDQLRLLQSDYGPRRWVLKSPAHLLAVVELAERFPEARFVWTHRDPLKAIASHASLTSVLIGVGSNRLDRADLGRRWAKVWSVAHARARQARDVIGHDRFFDLDHSDLVADPVAALSSIYSWMGWEHESMTQRWADHVRRHPRDGAGRHDYDPADFGLSPTIIGELFPPSGR